MKSTIALVVAVLAAMTVLQAAEDTKKEVGLQGKMGCAHCTYHKADRCAVGFKTSDGKIYILQSADESVMKQRFKGNEIKVKGEVSEKDGKLLVKASKVEILK